METLKKGAPKDRYFVVNAKGKLMSTAGAMTCDAPFDDDCYSAATDDEAKAAITAHSLTGCKSMAIPRYT